jgi:ribosomal protein L37AE/L43A
MAAAANSEILLKKKNNNEKQPHKDRCSICGKKLKFARTTENLLSCWQCMIVNADS